MEFVADFKDIEGIVPALAVIALGLIVFIVLVRRRPSLGQLGFVACDHADETANTLAKQLFGQPPRCVFNHKAADRIVFLMFVAAGSSDTPDCVVGFEKVNECKGAQDLALLHSERPIPKLLRHLNAGILEWTQPVNPSSDAIRPGKGWFWYAPDGDAIVKDSCIARMLARASRDRGSKKLLGLASLGAQFVVWASLPHVGEVVSHLESLTHIESDTREDRRHL